jgi:hypothetical protein
MSAEERAAHGTDERSEEERRRDLLDQLRRLRVADLVEEMLVSLVTVGYQKLGLTDQTRELRDLGDARLAIETLRAWIDVLARERGEEGLADLRATVATMQLEYARVAVRPAGEAAAGAPSEEAGAQSEEGGAPSEESAAPTAESGAPADALLDEPDVSDEASSAAARGSSPESESGAPAD